MQELFDKIWNFASENKVLFGFLWGCGGFLFGAWQWFTNKRDKDLEVMPEFEIKSLAFSENGRKFRLMNKSKIMVRVLEIKTAIPDFIDLQGSTALNWYLEENENNFYVQVRGRAGDITFSLIFENKLRRKYIQTVTFITGTSLTINSKWSITRAKRYRKLLIF